VKISLLVLCVLSLPLPAHAAESGPAAQCVRVGNDDTIRGYDPALQAGLRRAYARLFPQAHTPPDDRAFQAQAHVRCMDGRLLACFTGANLPCGRMNASRDNPGATAFCKADPQADVVPAFATGHDTVYAYRCVDGRPRVTGNTFQLDSRGFAASLWAPLD
jgi:hypothetical protein